MLGERIETARVRDVWVRKEGAAGDGSVGLVAGERNNLPRRCQKMERGPRQRRERHEERRGVNDAPESRVFVEPATDASR